jgi:hypothetical protein
MNAAIESADQPCPGRRRMRDSWSCMRTAGATATTSPAAYARGAKVEALAPAPAPAVHATRPDEQHYPSLLRRLALGLVFASLASAFLLVVLDAAPGLSQGTSHRVVSAVPLMAIGAAFLAAQIVLRPAPGELVKRILLAVAFLFWGVDALLPQYAWAALLNDAAIALFVLDLALVTQGHLDHSTAAARRVVSTAWKEGQ